jgi:hypothetical protein
MIPDVGYMHSDSYRLEVGLCHWGGGAAWHIPYAMASPSRGILRSLVNQFLYMPPVDVSLGVPSPIPIDPPTIVSTILDQDI